GAREGASPDQSATNAHIQKDEGKGKGYGESYQYIWGGTAVRSENAPHCQKRALAVCGRGTLPLQRAVLRCRIGDLPGLRSLWRTDSPGLCIEGGRNGYSSLFSRNCQARCRG